MLDPTAEKLALLLFDNYESCIIIPIIHLAKVSGLLLMAFYSYTSHKMQQKCLWFS